MTHFLRMQFQTTVECRALMWVAPSANALNPYLSVLSIFSERQNNKAGVAFFRSPNHC